MDDSLCENSDHFHLYDIKHNSGLETVDKEKHPLSIQPWDVFLLLVERGILALSGLRVRHPCHADDGQP